MDRQDLGQRVLERVVHVGYGGVVGIQRVPRLDEARPQPVPEDGLDLRVDPVADRRVVLRVPDHVLADDADAHAGERRLSLVAGGLSHDESGVRLVGNQGLRERGLTEPVEQRDAAARDHVLVANDPVRRQAVAKARKEPTEDVNLAAQRVGLRVEGARKLRVEALSHGHTPLLHGQVDGLPRREDRDRVADEPQRREAAGQPIEQRREQGVVLDE